ncbi:hypothetical protein P154DRAFT_448437, partial [Amniculicola lignicola CBS 123094]
GKGFRVSVPFFYKLNFNALVKLLKKCIERIGGKAINSRTIYREYLLGKVSNNLYSTVTRERGKS